MSRRLQLIRQYYQDIDLSRLDEVMAIFSEAAFYQRADVCFSGRREIEHFFRVERQIRGRHVVEKICEDAVTGTVTALGKFDGVGAKGDPRTVGFADFWQFDAKGFVSGRTTYLALGHQFVQA